MPGVEIRIVDDDGRSLSDGETGELLIKSPSAMECYVNAPDETREVLADGWFRTGDLATVSADGLVTIVGRKRERILRGGYSVFPPEVEAALLTHPAVAEAAVVGVPDSDGLVKPHAFVVARERRDELESELKAFVRDRLEPYKHPREVIFVDALPRTHLGKVDRGKLRRG